MSVFKDQWCQELDCIGGVGHNGIREGFVDVIRDPHDDHLLANSLGLHQAESGRIKNQKTIKSKTLLQSEERNNTV